MKTIVLDKISFFLFIKLILRKKTEIDIKILNDPSKMESFYVWILTFLRFRINIESFFFGDLYG